MYCCVPAGIEIRRRSGECCSRFSAYGPHVCPVVTAPACSLCLRMAETSESEDLYDEEEEEEMEDEDDADKSYREYYEGAQSS